MVISGGHSEVKFIADCESFCTPAELKAKVASLKTLAEGQLGETFQQFEATQFREQVVAGTVYHFKIVVSVNDDDDVVHIKAFEPLPFEKKPMKIMSIKKTKHFEELAIM